MQTTAHTHAIRHRTKGPVLQGRKSGIARRPLQQVVPPDGLPGSGAILCRFCERAGTEDCADSPAARVRGVLPDRHIRGRRADTRKSGAPVEFPGETDGRIKTYHHPPYAPGPAPMGPQWMVRKKAAGNRIREGIREVQESLRGARGRETPAAMMAHAWLVNYAFVLIILNHYI